MKLPDYCEFDRNTMTIAVKVSELEEIKEYVNEAYKQGREDALYDLWNKIIGKYDDGLSLEELAIILEEVK